MTVSRSDFELTLDTIGLDELDKQFILEYISDLREEIKELEGELLEAQFPKYSKHRRNKWDDE